MTPEEARRYVDAVERRAARSRLDPQPRPRPHQQPESGPTAVELAALARQAGEGAATAALRGFTEAIGKIIADERRRSREALTALQAEIDALRASIAELQAKIAVLEAPPKAKPKATKPLPLRLLPAS